MAPQMIPKDGWPTAVGGEAISGLSGVSVPEALSSIGVEIWLSAGDGVGVGSGGISGTSLRVLWITYNDIWGSSGDEVNAITTWLPDRIAMRTL